MKAIGETIRATMARIAGERAVVIATLLGPIVGVMLALGSLSAQETKGEAKTTVTIDNFTFSPAELTVATGTTITWVNHDDIPHSVVENDKKFRSKALDTDDSYSFTFTTAGTFQYFCGLHPHMVGKVIVKP
jgi:plastocyanin